MAAAVMPTSTGLSGGSLETCVAYCQTYVCGGGKASAAAAAASGSFLHHPCNLAAAGVQGLSSSRGDSSSSSCWKEGQSTTTMSRFNGRRRRLQVLQQAAPSTLNSPENVAMKNLQVGPIPDMMSLSTRTGFLGPPPPSISKPEPPTKISLAELVAPVAEDLGILNNNLHLVVGSQNPVLMSAAKQIFGAGGKRMRPALIFLVSKATAEVAGLNALQPQHRRLAEITEMIHTASLIHDDVLDESDVRRGKQAVHRMLGTRVAVLAGDFMFAQSSWYLANLDNLEVIKLISQVISDFASGEIKQASSLFDCDVTLQDYLDKSFYKTASLIAASTRSAAIFSGVNACACDQMFEYGMNLGLAFQIVDDILDFTQTSEQLGKPAGSDLSKGNLTAPVLFALQREPELRELIDSEFMEEGSLDAAISLVHRSGGIDRARELAKQKGDLARQALDSLPQGPLRQSLDRMVDYVLERVY
ncbi:unnamed protein product [Sphagnum jensenii]|uniref:Solanesyl diphosphate synthase n=1 Tax=Sphagnum jensenii TaxID=128206 RepID=A0ABP1BYI6_9BRYO